MVKEQADAVIVQLSLPCPSPLLAQEGALMSYSPHQGDLYHRAAVYIDRILKGAKAADLPVEFPARFELAVNLKTAKTLGIVVPPTVMARADEVIE